MEYERYITRVLRRPWALTAEKLEEISELMYRKANGLRVSDDEIADRFGSRRRPSASAGGGAIAVIPIHGTIAHRADSFSASSGGTSTELIGRQLQQAINDDSIGSVVLDFETPGGSVEGVPELAATIAAAADVKPVIAHVNALAASAGYWLAAQCTEIVCTPSGQVGSIGVYMLSLDRSEALAKEGTRINAISAGDHKLEGVWWQPMSDETRAFYQSQVDDMYRQFVAAVAKGREVSVGDVKRNYGQGRVYDSKTALSKGMIDRIATFDDTLARMVSRRAPALGRSARRGSASVKDEHHNIMVAMGLL